MQHLPIYPTLGVVMIKVISFKICPFFQYVTAMLEAKKLAYDVEYADFDNCLFAVSPNGKAPILISESGTALFDADAIVNYLENIGEHLYIAKDAEQAALIEAWANYGSKNYVPQCSAMRSASEEEYQHNFSLFNKSLINIEKQLANGPYFLGEQLSRVDIAWLPLLHRAQLVEIHTGIDSFKAYPKIKAWQQSLISLPWLESTVSDDFTSVFTDFYLSSGYPMKT